MRRAAIAVLRVLTVIGLLALYALELRAQASDELEEDVRAALLEHVRLESGHYVAHCRRAHGGCEARMRRTAALLVRAGRDHGVDAWLLAAIAIRESGGNPDAVGERGELGLMQLHPQSRAGRYAIAACERDPRHCPAIVVDAAARLLASAIAQCGNESAALGMYNRGRCGETSYSRAVLARRDRMRGRS